MPNRTIVRQFARAAIADRLVGDEVVRLALSRADADGLEAAELLKRFVQAWRLASAGNGKSAAMFSDRALLASLPPPPGEERLMLLLVDVLGFSLEEARAILAPMDKEASAALAEGRRLVENPRDATAIVIEDEPLIAAELRGVLEKMGVRVGGFARTAARAVTLADETMPDLILADYNLEDGETGADAIAAIHQSHDCPVIFITGYPDKVLQGEEVEPDFVIAKPYRIPAVRAAVAHCLDARIAVERD